jgi:uncharacterized protein (DUF305 family)
MLLIKSWLVNRLGEMSDIEKTRSLHPATRELLQQFIRHTKGLITALERWLEKVS